MQPQLSCASACSQEDAAVRRRSERFAALVLALFLALLVHSAWRVGPTYDEHYYIASGYSYWQEGEFALNREHPPLLKLLFALPLLFAPGVDYPAHALELVDYPVAFFYQHNAAALDRNLFLARLGPCLLSALCALAVFTTARRLFGSRAGLVALLLFAFNPNVLAHGPLAALDMGVAVLLFFAAKYTCALLETPSWRALSIAGLCFGLANLAKFTGLLLGPFCCLLALAAAVRQRSFRPLGWTLGVFLVGLGVFAAGYGFEAKSINAAWGDRRYVMERVPARAADPQPAELAALERELSQPDPVRAAAAIAAAERFASAASDTRKRLFAAALQGAPVPSEPTRLRLLSDLCGAGFVRTEDARSFFESEHEADWGRAVFTQAWIDTLARSLCGTAGAVPLFSALKGVDFQLFHGNFGHGSYFRGQTIQPGKTFANGNPYPEYYSWVLAVKNPLCFLLLAALGLALAVRRDPHWTLLRALTLVGFPTLCFYLFSSGSALLGIKYLLPVLPFLCVLAGRSAVLFPRSALVVALLAVAESLWIHPHELMYYNAAAGGPVGGPRITVVGDDWGQGVRSLGRWYQANRGWVDAAGGLWCDPYTAGDKAALGLECSRPIPKAARSQPKQKPPVQGIVAVNVVDLYREQADYTWLAGYAPFERLDWSVYLYDTRQPPPGGTPPELAGATR